MARELARHRYEAFGVTIESAFPLPELPALDDASATGAESPLDSTAADVEIRRGTVEPVTGADDGEPGRSVAVDPDGLTVTFDVLGSVRVEGGERVVVDLLDETLASSKVLRRVIEGQILAVVLHQRGLLVLHASAVAIDDRAALFVGPQGAGKTTTAAACYAEGFDLLDDDVVAVEIDDDGRPAVRPGVPELKLYPETATALGVPVSPAEHHDAGSAKQYHYPSVDANRTTVPLAGCYRLATGETLELTEIPPRERFVTLLVNTYTAGLLDETETSPEHFQLCSSVLDAAPIQELTRPDALDDLPALADLVAEDLRS